jgi:hypothetical protein
MHDQYCALSKNLFAQMTIERTGEASNPEFRVPDTARRNIRPLQNKHGLR